MSLCQLEYFVAVAEEEHLTRAAARLCISQPPLTRQIKNLEEELGTPLFQRTQKGMRLLPEGRALLPEAQAILARVKKLPSLLVEHARKPLNGNTGHAQSHRTGPR